MPMPSLDAFLLTRDWRDTPEGLEYELWAASNHGPVRIRMTNQEAVCFVPSDATAVPGGRASVDLATLDGEKPVDAVYFPAQRELVKARNRLKARGILCHESDVKPVDRFLMERFITGSVSVLGDAIEKPGFLEFVNPRLSAGDYRPRFSTASVDIETEGLTGRLYSIAVVAADTERAFMVGEGPDGDPLTFFNDERALLKAFMAHIGLLDPDLLLGWNVVDFDVSFLARRCEALGLPFLLGRDKGPVQILSPRQPGQPAMALMAGRVVLDGILALKMAMYPFESYSLESVGQTMLGRGKLLHHPNRVDEINRLYCEEPRQLAAYNLEDCRLVLDIFARAHLVDFAVERASLTGLSLGRPGGSVAAFDFLYLPRLHRRGYVAPDLDAAKDVRPSPGGYVMDSQPGLYENVLVLDFKSLYPSIIRTFHIDPLALAVPGEDPIPGFEGAAFSRETAILPGLLESLWMARDRAKRDANKPLSQAIKILMNSFYGVLGTPGCRFFDPKLAGSVTRYGHSIITKSREFLEARGRRVIYGDTDSLFILLGPGHDEIGAAAIGQELARALNAWWRDHLRDTLRIESFLEIEFEKHYLRFLMPTIRGSEKGSKKRYAGLLRESDGQLSVAFTGMESVRTDWTPLARNFQRELYRRVFCDEPYEAFVRQTAHDLLAGRLDEQLAYRKRLRKPIEAYECLLPPHVRAAQREKPSDGWISYVMTAYGPRPVSDTSARPDYFHYLDRQLAPAADALLHYLGTSFSALLDRQLELF